ncbi:type II secretion system protein GspG [bacterium]|nr:type II secretion system protein GspG [bacterium]
MKKRKGFTFIELLVTTTIILLLSSIAMVSYQSANKRGRDNKRKADLEKVRTALEMYRTDNGAYPLTEKWEVMISALKDGNYLNEEPTDPKGYSYYYNSDNGKSYELCAYLEAEGETGSCETASCGEVTCNYKLTNP